MIIQRPRGFFIVIKPPGKPHVVLGGPYDKELARIKDKKLVEEYIDLHIVSLWRLLKNELPIRKR